MLRNVSFRVSPGSLFGLLGPNGAGKTTLFKILSTLVTLDEGSVIIGGCDLSQDAAQIRAVLTPVTADERSLNWRLSARENLRLYGALYGLRGRQLANRIDDLLASVELEDAGSKIVGQFSSGMKQRLLIARALVHRPRILLLDEPTRSLDPITARNFRTLLKERIVAEERCTVLLATHDPEEALGFCDGVAILDRGRVVSVGAPQKLADELVGERYSVWTCTPRHPAFEALLHAGSISSIAAVSRTENVSVLEIRLAAGGTEPADILASLVKHGARISRFEKSPLGLAELIERAITAAERDARA